MYYEEFENQVDIIGVVAKENNIKKVLTLLKNIYDLDIDVQD